MIFLQLHWGGRIIILEPGNIEALQDGRYVTMPDKSVQIMYSPDAKWIGEEIAKAAQGGALDAEVLAAIHRESMTRPPVKERDYHPPQTLIDNRPPGEKPN